MGYTSQPQFTLAIDFETSGFSYPDYASKHQALSIGAAIVRNSDLEIVDYVYHEIKFDSSKYIWSDQAQKVHGISREHLEKNGISMEEVAFSLGNLIVKYFDPQSEITILGHNPLFDIAFLKQVLEPFEIMPKLTLRVLDSSILAFALFNNTKSDNLFEKLGFDARGAHNSLEDIILTIEAFKKVRALAKFLPQV